MNNHRLPILVTERLLLRPAAMEDLLQLHGLWTEPQLARHFWDGNPISLAESERTLDTFLRHGMASGLGLWRVTLHNDRCIGFCGFWPRADERVPELLIGLRPACWGLGYGPEAVRSVTTYAFERNLLRAVRATCDQQNFLSIGLLKKLGFELQERTPYAGRTTHHYLLGGAPAVPHACPDCVLQAR